MKKVMWVALALSLFAIGAQAQQAPAGDASVGYSYFRLGGSNGVNMNGVSGSLAYNANDWFGVVGDLGFYHASPAGIGLSNTTYTFGPRFSVRSSSKVVPFAQALFGGAHLSALGATSNPFAYSMGGGVDMPISSSGKAALRPQFEYVGLRSNGSTTNSFRLSVGVVFHLGSR